MYYPAIYNYTLHQQFDISFLESVIKRNFNT